MGEEITFQVHHTQSSTAHGMACIKSLIHNSQFSVSESSSGHFTALPGPSRAAMPSLAGDPTPTLVSPD
jgi:hypothetical protein